MFVTYLYWTSWAGLRALAGRIPTLLVPTAHDEPTLRLPLLELLFALPDAIAFLTEEEAALVRERFPGAPPGAVLGAGVDIEALGSTAIRSRRSGAGTASATGRISSSSADSIRGRAPTSSPTSSSPIAIGTRRATLALVVVGEPMYELAPHPDIVVTGFVDDDTRRAAVAGATIAVQPSYFESFSLVLAEAWVEAKPALVQRACAVTNGQVQRSGGGIPYRGYAEFEAAVDLLLDSPELAATLGARGRRYVDANYRWTTVLPRYERVLRALAG